MAGKRRRRTPLAVPWGPILVGLALGAMFPALIVIALAAVGFVALTKGRKR